MREWRMDALNSHDLSARLAVAGLAILIALGLWQAYGEWLFGTALSGESLTHAP
jgi:hypothetical protein